MPVDINSYRDLSSQSGTLRTNAPTVHLSKSGNLVIGGGRFFGRIVSWFKGYRSQQHIETRNHFINALSAHYGEGITSQAISTGGLSQSSKKPLNMREVFITFQVVDNLQAANQEKNNQLASRYGVVQVGDSEIQPKSTDHLESGLSNTLAEMFPNNSSEDDVAEVRDFIDITATGEQIKSKILEKGDNGKTKVSQKTADTIAKQAFQTEAVQAYTALVVNKHYIIKGHASSMSQETVDYLNEKMEADLTAEIYKEGDKNPKFPSQARVAEIAENIRSRISTGESAVASLNISDDKLKTEVTDFVIKSGLSVSQVKTAWETGGQIQPHLQTMADANSTEAQLEKAINEYTNAVSDLQSKDDIKDLSGELREQRSTLMMMAQGGDWRATMDKMHRQITTPGALNSYIRATNHYRLSFPGSDAYKKQEASLPDFYRSGLRTADTFSTWMESLGFASAAMLNKSGGEAEIVAQSAPLESASEIEDRTLHLMRNTGIKIPTPDRMGQSGGGTFSDAAVKYVEKELSSGKVDSLQEDGISKQFLKDIGVRATAYFNESPAAKAEAEVIEQLKEFCTTDGELNKDMLFAISQFHQGSVGAVFQVFKREQLAPVHGFFVGSGEDPLQYHFNKHEDGSVSVKIKFEKNKPKLFTPVYVDTSVKNPSYDVMLDSDASEFGLDMEFLLKPEQFSATRDKFPVPEITNLTYHYGLYEEKE